LASRQRGKSEILGAARRSAYQHGGSNGVSRRGIGDGGMALNGNQLDAAWHLGGRRRLAPWAARRVVGNASREAKAREAGRASGGRRRMAGESGGRRRRHRESGGVRRRRNRKRRKIGEETAEMAKRRGCVEL